jgi:outer membrane protein OmpA-like peptidoglycan-associated protein
MPQRPGAQPGATPPAAAQTAPGMQQRPGMLAPAAAANAPVDPKTMPQRLDQVRNERHEVREGNRIVIQESNRIIIREGGRDIIRHDPVDRFRFNAREVNVEHRGNNTVTVVLRPDGARIVTEVDESGRLLRRVRRDAMGREVILIDNSFEPRGPGVVGFFVDLRPPVIRIAPELYIREAGRATAADIFLTLMAPPVERIERRYALDEILYNEPLRARMPRIDIDTVNFETASWEITPDQADRLAFVAQGILNAVKKNPGEMFLVEGYTDAVGNDVDNLSLSDHRAESVAVMLTNQFGVPAENLTTQGYGKQFLKVPTDGPERANRRVAVRRITPLLNGGQG